MKKPPPLVVFETPLSVDTVPPKLTAGNPFGGKGRKKTKYLMQTNFLKKNPSQWYQLASGPVSSIQMMKRTMETYDDRLTLEVRIRESVASIYARFC